MSTVLAETATTELNAQRAAAFEERFVTALNESGMLLLTSLGHRSGLLNRLSCQNFGSRSFPPGNRSLRCFSSSSPLISNRFFHRS